MEIKHHSFDHQHPFAGLYPFGENDRDYFFGREREINDLFGLIQQKVLTVVFGKSGVGKTSLLRAGLIPRLRGNFYLPVYLRIDFENRAKSPIVQVKEAIEAKINEVDSRAVPFGNSTLWEYFSYEKILDGNLKPLLIFDQFEEIFTGGKNQDRVKNEFVTEIADLIDNRVPKAVQERKDNEKRKIPSQGRDPGLKVIFSLREDYLAQLETFSLHIPAIGLSRYRISLMKRNDAVSAVKGQAKAILADDGTVEEIIKKIPTAGDADYKPFESGADARQTGEIEPFLLSLFCYRANEKRLKNRKGLISLELIRDMSAEEILRNYYEESIADFPFPVKYAVEDLLLTPQGCRKLQDINGLKESMYRVMDEHIETLVSRRLIRKESRGGIDYVELIHDVLAPVLKESRDKRKEREAAQKKNRKWFIIAVTVSVLVILALFIAIRQVQQAKIKIEKENALEETQRVDQEKRKKLAYEWAAYSIDLQKRDRDLSFRLAEQACKQEKDDPVSRRTLLSVFYEAGFYRELTGNNGSEFSQTKSEKSDFFAAFSPDGTRILTVITKKAILWNWDGQKINKEREYPFPENTEFRPNASFSPDGNAIVFCTKAGNRVVIWDLSTKQLKSVTVEWEINSVSFSPDKSNITFITACRDNNIRQFDLSGKLKKTFSDHSGEVISALYSKDGQFIISAAWDNTVRIWDLTGAVIEKNDKVSGIKTADIYFSRDKKERRVVTGSADGTVQWWDFKLTKAQTLGKHQSAVTSAVFSPDGQYILSGGDDSTVRLLTLNNFLVIEFKETKDVIRIASFSPDGKYILIAPANGPAELRPIDPELIIDLVNRKGKVRPLTNADRLSYNIPQT